MVNFFTLVLWGMTIVCSGKGELSRPPEYSDRVNFQCHIYTENHDHYLVEGVVYRVIEKGTAIFLPFSVRE